MQQRLIVKNFGPVKEVDISFDKLLVMIGPQGSGKSTIAKLLAIINDLFQSLEFNISKFNQLLLKYNIDFDFDDSFSLEYQYKKRYLRLRHGNDILHQNPADIVLGAGEIQKPFSWKENFYVPAERIFIPTIANASFSFLKNDIAIPKFLLDFGEKFQKARLNTKRLNLDFMHAMYERKEDGDFIYYSETEAISLSKSSSGMQAVVPLMILFNYLKNNNDKAASVGFFIEEPEMNLYPENQAHLINFLVEYGLDKEDTMTIATHSPYILSALNNLLYAFNLSQKMPREVSRIIKEKYWIDPAAVGAYKLSDGYARSIIDEDLQLIKTEEIDEASDQINNIFDQLFELEHNEGLRKVS